MKRKRKGKLLHVRLHSRTHQRLKVLAAQMNTTMQTWTNRAIRAALRQQRELETKEKSRTIKAEKNEKSNDVQP